MISRPDWEPEEYAGPRRLWRELSERLERLRRQYGAVCCVLCVFTATGVVLTGVLPGWLWKLFMVCYTVMLAAWVGASVLLLLRTAALAIRSRILAMWPEPPSSRPFGTAGQRAAAWEARGGSPAPLEDNPPAGWPVT